MYAYSCISYHLHTPNLLLYMCCHRHAIVLPSSCLSHLIALLCLDLPPSFFLVCCTCSHCLTFICHSLCQTYAVLLQLLLYCRVGAGLVMPSGGLPYISKPASCWQHLPPPGGGLLLTSCCAFAACTCFQVTPCILRSLSACLLDLERFSYGRGRSRSLLPCPAMSTLTSCLACTVRLQHACVRPCTL
jgi:hypothetical protein